MPVRHLEHKLNVELKTPAFDAKQVLDSMAICEESRVFGIIAQQTRELGEALWPHFRPSYTYRVVRITNRNPGHASIQLNGTTKLAGHGIYQHLRAGEYAVVFFLTVGCVKKHLSKLSEDDPLKAYLLHAIATSAVHASLRLLQQALKQETRRLGASLGHRFAPGYARWDLREQKKLFEMTRANAIGLTLSSSFSLLPEYSISGVYNMTERQTPTSRPDQNDLTQDRLYA